MTSDQQAKHDEVMSLAVNFAIAIREANKFEPANHSPAREKLSAAIAQLCAKPDRAEQVPVGFEEWRFELLTKVDAYINAQYENEGDELINDSYDELKAHILQTPFTAPLNIAQQAPVNFQVCPSEFNTTGCVEYPIETSYQQGLADGAIDMHGQALAAYTDLQSQLSQAQEENARLKAGPVPTDDDSLWNIAGMVSDMAVGSLFNVSQKEAVTRIRALFMDPDAAREFIKSELKP